MGRGPVIKKVFVTFWFKGRNHSFLCDAVQKGKHFEVSVEAWNEMSRKLNLQRGQTYSVG